jgi:hypothetical protein
MIKAEVVFDDECIYIKDYIVIVGSLNFVGIYLYGELVKETKKLEKAIKYCLEN